MLHNNDIFEIDLTPTVKMTFLKGGVKVAVAAVLGTIFLYVVVFLIPLKNVTATAATNTF